MKRLSFNLDKFSLGKKAVSFSKGKDRSSINISQEMSAATHSLDKADKRKYCHGHNIWISHCILRFNVSVMEGRKYFHQCCDLMEVVFSWLHVMSLLLNKGYETFWPSKPGHVFFGPLLFRYVGLQHTHKKKKNSWHAQKKALDFKKGEIDWNLTGVAAGC